MGLSNVRDSREFKVNLEKYIKDRKGEKPIIVVFIIPKEDKYKDFKKCCYDLGVRSQVISFNVAAKKFNLAIASNILKQINSKLCGDLFRI